MDQEQNNHNNPSRTYLLDKHRSGRLKYKKGCKNKPELKWRIRLPNSPPCSPESTVVFDGSSNLYFGCHDGNFYSLDSSGKIRWSYRTKNKIYSSPLITSNPTSVCFASGDGYLYCLNDSGELLWKELIGVPVSGWTEKLIQQYHKRHSHTLHEVNRIASACSWASPNIVNNDTICVTGYSLGLSAVNKDTGALQWRVELGRPSAHLTGVAISKDEFMFAVAQQESFCKISSDGKVMWRRRLKRGFNSWGNPSIDPERGTIYVPVSRRESGAIVYAFNPNGKLKWKSLLPEGTRGAVGISRENYLTCCGYGGNLYLLDKDTGCTIKAKNVTEGNLWTSCSIDPEGYIFISTIDSQEGETGRVCCYDKDANFVWDYEIGRGHSVPVVDSLGQMYVGSWNGEYFCLQT